MPCSGNSGRSGWCAACESARITLDAWLTWTLPQRVSILLAMTALPAPPFFPSAVNVSWPIWTVKWFCSAPRMRVPSRYFGFSGRTKSPSMRLRPPLVVPSISSIFIVVGE